jgi:hypothetical protein
MKKYLGQSLMAAMLLASMTEKDNTGWIPDDSLIQSKRSSTRFTSTLNGKQKAKRKRKNKAQKTARKRNR